MTCDQAKERFPELWAGTLSPKERAELEMHAAECPACEMESAHLGSLWNEMGRLPEPKPSAEMKHRFLATLAAYEMGIASERKKAKAPWWQFGPALQFGLAAAMLVVGLGLGWVLTSARQASPEVAQLRGELQNMRHLMTLSLLQQQQSSSDRLRGVTYSVRAAPEDSEVLSALVYTLQHDQTVNVRLAAADALRNFRENPLVRRTLPSALALEKSPLVQVALIDLLRDMRSTESDAALRRVSEDPEAVDVVRARAKQALEMRKGVIE
ncbi:MAG: zf-HC2 domain-containing protein [Bryobacteraceae bacterium]|nr:zf-HC2 domain-containing protein [Bryobacteraceae bacterium]